jgi:hypothetical protein
MNRIHSLLITLILLLPIVVFAQKEYALTPKGDTLKGKLKMISFDDLDRLQINTDGKKSSYTALQIRSYQKEGNTYQSVKYENSFRFMKMIKSGYLSLLAFNTSGQGGWNSRYLIKKDGSGMEVPNLSFKKLLSKYLSDCPEVHDRIEIGDFTRNDLERIIDLYNSCLQAKTDVLITTKAPTISFNVERMLAVAKLSEKVQAESFLTKNDVIDLLKDIKIKVSKNEVVPNYLIEGLKSYLSDTPSLLKEAEELATLLKK